MIGAAKWPDRHAGPIRKPCLNRHGGQERDAKARANHLDQGMQGGCGKMALATGLARFKAASGQGMVTKTVAVLE